MDAITEEPPPSRHWDTPDLDLPPLRQSARNISFQWLPSGLALLAQGSRKETKSPKSNLPKNNRGLNVAVLIIGASKPSAALLRHMAEGDEPLAVVQLTRRIEYAESGGERLPVAAVEKSEAKLYSLGTGGTLLLAVGCHNLAPELCFAWTRSVFSEISPFRVVIFGALPMGSFRGGDIFSGSFGSKNVPAFHLRTSASNIQNFGNVFSDIPPLPPGNLTEGLPAALISHCQARNIPGFMILLVEQHVEVVEKASVHLIGQFIIQILEGGQREEEVLELNSPELRIQSVRSLVEKAANLVRVEREGPQLEMYC